MITLQTHIRNLRPLLDFCHPLGEPQTVTLRMGSLEAEISMKGEGNTTCGGKRIILGLQREQVKKYLATYTLGLFMQNASGRYWCIMSLQSVGIGQEYCCSRVFFYNDNRNQCYLFDFSVELSEHHPKPLKIKQTNPRIQTTNLDKRPATFLYGNKTTAISKNKRKQRPQEPTRNQRPERNEIKQPFNSRSFEIYQNRNCQPFDNVEQKCYLPPAMQFTNDEAPADQGRESYASFNSHEHKAVQLGLFPSEHPAQYKQHSKSIVRKEKEARLKQLRQLARKEAQSQMAKRQNQIMVPVPNQQTGLYELIPLSKMSESQIIQYASKHKLADQFRQLQNQRKLRREKKKQKTLQKQQLIGKLQQQSRKQIISQNIGSGKKFNQKERISQKNKESSSEGDSSESQEEEQPKIQGEPYKNGQKFREQKNENSDQQDYESDFESISNVGSQLKSRISLQSSISMSQDKQKKKVNQSDISESMNDYEYSQDFDSFSQSLASKNKRGSGISEISGSYASVSNRKL